MIGNGMSEYSNKITESENKITCWLFYYYNYRNFNIIGSRKINIIIIIAGLYGLTFSSLLLVL